MMQMDDLRNGINRECKGCACMSPMFELLTDEELSVINKGKITVLFRAGETIRKQGTFMSHVTSLNSGLAKLYLEGRNQKHTIMRIVRPTNFIGGPGMYLDQVHHFSLSAMQDTIVCFIEMQSFKQIIFQNKAFGEEFLKDFSSNILLVYQRLINLTQKQIPGRMADSLIYLFEDVFKSNRIDFHFSRQDLADLAGISKDSCVKILREFEEDGIILFRSHGIELLDEPALKKISMLG